MVIDGSSEPRRVTAELKSMRRLAPTFAASCSVPVSMSALPERIASAPSQLFCAVSARTSSVVASIVDPTPACTAVSSVAFMSA